MTTGFVVAAILVILGLSVGAAMVRSRSNAGAAPTVPSASAIAPKLQVPGEQDGHIQWDHPLELRVTNGTFDDVLVTDDSGVTLTGIRAHDRRRWVSTGALAPHTTYTVAAGLVDGTGDR